MAGKLVLEAIGGLGNRMRALDSAIEFCRKYDKELHLVWPYFKGLNCPFNKLFDIPETISSISYPSEISRFKLISNLKVSFRKISRISYPFIYDKYLNKKKVYQLDKSHYSFEELAKYKSVRIQTDIRFLHSDARYKHIRPISELKDKINSFKDKYFDCPVVGIHIRRTDHTMAISHSPTSVFEEMMDSELLQEPQTKFFLATDSESERKILLKKFGDKIIYQKNIVLSRNSVDGIQQALVDMYLLADCKKIIGSFQSTFCFVAAEINGIPLEIINEKNTIPEIKLR